MLIASKRFRRHLAVLWVGLVQAGAMAQAPATQPPEGARPRDPLATKQQIVRDRMAQLEDRMFRLTEKLAQSEPEQARKLESAMKQAQEMLVRRNMDEAVELLQSGKLTDAADRQTNVVKGLEGVLRILLEESDNTKQRQAEIDRLRAYQERVQKLLENERQLKAQSESANRLERMLRSIQAAIGKLESLIEKEQRQVEAAAAARSGQNAEAGKMSEEQKAVREETEALARELENAGQDAAAGESDSAGDRPPRAGDTPAGPPQEGGPRKAQGVQPSQNQDSSPPEAGGGSNPPEQGGSREAGSPQGASPRQPDKGESGERQDGSQDPARSAEKGSGAEKSADPQRGHEKPASAEEPAGEAAIEAGIRQAQGDVRRAGEEMKAAEGELGRQKPEEALPLQKKSVESLRRALQELKRREEQTRRQLDHAEAARKQRELQRQAQQMAEGMKKGESPEQQAGGQKGGEQQGGQQQPGQQGGQQQGGQQEGGQQNSQQGPQQQQNARNERPQEPIPGNHNVEQAGKHMEKAADDLEQNELEEAAPEQQRAIEQLEQAQRELDQTLDQLRREQQEEMLRGLESRFRAMLAQQLLIYDGTVTLEKKGAAAWEHIDELKLASLSQDQSTVADQAGQALHILKEEGTTVVFPRIVEQMREDMNQVASLLVAKKTGARTQRIEEEIVATLRELTESIKELRRKIQNGEAGGNQGQQGQPGQNPPLLPGSAELKLLRSCQQRVNRDTADFNEYQAGRDGLDDEGRSRLNQITARQQEVAELARKMNERLTGQ